MDERLVVCRQLGRSFPDGSGRHIPVLRDVDCEILPGARIGLVGPSGSGKTTLLHIFGGLDSPTSGVIDWPALGSRERLRPREVGIVFQSPSLFPALTAIQNVELPRLLAGQKADPGASLALLAAFGLGEVAEKLPEELSGGQAQRVATARALALAPRLVLADEPTGQLDSLTAQHFFDVLLDLLKGTRTALIVATHDETIAARMATRWSMDHGRLVQNQSEMEVVS
jgi:putative ABC transport system ATP-binding protein/lipoprotein-releasing system ATP-binding protein